jgi:DNA-binding response OmpR family regulator
MGTNWSPLRILVVDDNRDAADSLAMLAKMWGHDVDVGYNGTAIDRVPIFKPDVVLLDIAMPRLDGNKFARQMRERPESKDVLVIAVTGFHDEARRLLSKEAGIDHYLIKPADPSVLKKLLLIRLLEKNQGQAISSPAGAAPERTP